MTMNTGNMPKLLQANSKSMATPKPLASPVHNNGTPKLHTGSPKAPSMSCATCGKSLTTSNASEHVSNCGSECL